jgi:hypothetical protein
LQLTRFGDWVSKLERGIAMSSPTDRSSPDRPGRNPAHALRAAPRATPRIEVLETRCLMSGGRISSDLEYVPAPSLTSFHRPVQVKQNAEVSSTQYSVHAESDEAGGDLSNVVVPTGMAPGSYVIVHETAGPHSTFATAQVLPEVPFFGVIGTLSTLDSIDLFRMTVGAGTTGFQVALVSQRPTPGVPLEFWLFDASGRVAGHWSSSDASVGSPLDLVLAGQPPGATVYLGISAANPAGSPPAVDYQLWVDQLSTLNPQSPGPASPALPTSATTSAALVVPLSATAPFASQTIAAPQDSSPVESSAGPALGARPAIGALPSRSAGPSGGVMAGDVANPAAATLAASLDAEGPDRPLPATSVDARREENPRTLVALRGPGGFPLLGATALGNWRRASAAPSVTTNESALDETAEGLRVEAPVSPTPALPLQTDTAPAAAEAPRPRTRGILRASLSSGLGLATVLTLNVVLSDPIAGFDYLAARFDLSGRKRRRTEAEPPHEE